MSQPPEAWPVPQGDLVKDWLDANFSAYFESSPAQIQVNRVLGLTQSTVTGSVPAGAMVDYGGTTAPAGWVACDGATYDGTTTTYAALWAAIGTTWGGTGQSAFKVPDSGGRATVGYVASGGHADVSTIGNSDGVAKANRRPKHRHTPHNHHPGRANHSLTPGTTPFSMDPGGATYDSFTDLTDGGSGNANDSLDAPAYLVCMKIIKL